MERYDWSTVNKSELNTLAQLNESLGGKYEFFAKTFLNDTFSCD